MSNQDYELFWVTGTDTDVGKSVVSAMLVTALGASYWKPVQSGTHTVTDKDYVKGISGFSDDHFIGEVYKTTQPLSPHLSATLDGVTIELNAFRRPHTSMIKNNRLIIEGAGGVLVPLNSDKYVIDLIKQITAPVIIVCRSTLGTINHTLTTLEALRSRGIPIKGFIMNGPKNIENERAVRDYGQVQHLGSLPLLQKVDRDGLLKIWHDEGFDSHFNV